MYFQKPISVIIFVLLSVFLLGSCATTETGTTVYLVRHAEKVIGENVGRDPELTDAGQARAELLADMLAAKKISHIHSSDYIRTRDTAKPLAEKTGLEIEIYDPRDLVGLAAKIENVGGSHLVVGHSNTIPETVVALSGDGGSPIEEANEYDRLYTVRISSDGKVLTDLSRYGDQYTPTEK
jgi:phosphohistidine phosphatase SixA